MNSIKKAIAGLGLTFGILAGGAVLAPAANAVTTTYDYYRISSTTCQVWAYVDYNWWEETFQGKRDQYFRMYNTSC